MTGRSRIWKSKAIVGLVIIIFAVVVLAMILRSGRSGCQSESGRGYWTDTDKEQGDLTARGSIYDRNFKALAVSFPLVSMFARPLALVDPDLAASGLAPLLGWDEDALRREFRSTRGFVWLAGSVPPEISRQVMSLGLEGIRLVDDFSRYYPMKTTGAHVIGFQQDEQGLAGVESQYDAVLRGEGHIETGVAELYGNTAFPDTPGNLMLSIDIRSQKLLEKKLAKIRQDSIADQAMALLMDPQNGEILALVNLPSFDPNRFWEYDVDLLKNRVIKQGVNPGEMRRIFRLAAALQAGVPEVSEIYEENGNIGGKVILPRLIKETRSLAPYGVERAWSFVQPGMYVSREVTALPDPLVDQESLDILEFQLGFNRQSQIDLPAEDASPADGAGKFSLTKREGKTSAINLLTAFARLVGGHHELRPHLVRMLWSNAAQPKMPSQEGASPLKDAGQSGLQDGVLDIFSETVNKGPGGSIFFESLVEVEEEAAGEDVLLARMTTNLDFEGQHKYQGILLGAAPFYAPEIAVLVVVDGAFFDPSKASIMRRELYAAVDQLLKWRRSETKMLDSAAIDRLEEEVFVAWQEGKNREKCSAVPVVLRGEKKMPDVIGMSLRKALQQLGDCDLAIRITGAGRVVIQHPAAGSALKDKECLLELQMDH